MQSFFPDIWESVQCMHMENTFQLQHEQAEQEGLTARLPSKSPSAQGKGQHVVALFLDQRKDQVVTKSSLLSAESCYSQPQGVCSCTGLFMLPVALANTQAKFFVPVLLHQSLFTASPQISECGGEKQQQNKTKNVVP